MKIACSKLFLFAAATSLLLVGGCSKSGNDEKAGALTDSSRNTTEQQVVSGQPINPVQASTADKSVPLDKYALFRLNDEDRHFARLFYAIKGVPASDEEVLNVLSADYYNERDGFKKQEIKSQIIPRITAELEQYKNMRYVAFESDDSRLGAYDFSKKGFPLNNSGIQAGCLRTMIKTTSGVDLKFRDITTHCFASVEDVELAKTIESYRANLKGPISYMIFAYAEDVRDGYLEFTPIAIKAFVKQSFDQNAPVIAELKF